MARACPTEGLEGLHQPEAHLVSSPWSISDGATPHRIEQAGRHELLIKLTETWLREQVDDATWKRGVAYHEQDRVRNVVLESDTAVATVEGQAPYRVRFTQLDDRLVARCSCPVGKRGQFCKHCVAVGLALIAADSESVSVNGYARATRWDRYDREIELIRAHLADKDRSAMIDLIVEQAMEDDRLLKRLRIESLTTAAEVDRKAVRKAITEATRTRGFVDYRRAGNFARGIEQMVHGLASLLERGFAKDVIPLTEYALRRVERAIEHVDDSDGYMRPILNDLQTLHHAACAAAKPSPVKLARRIFEWETTSDWEVFLGATNTYADVFGESGMAEYRRLAEAAWEKVSALGPGDERRSLESHRFQITYAMEALARQSADLDALIDVKRRDLSSAYQFLGIAELLRDAGRIEDAVDWAERGHAAFPDRTDSRLLAFLADIYRQLGREDDALHMIWQDFADHPGHLEAYQRLKVQAERVDTWSTWRERAMDRLRADRRGVRDPRHHGEWRTGPVSGHSSLVSILVWEGHADAAWQEARGFGCSIDQWITLARHREANHPHDAVCIYQDTVADLVRQTNNAAYAEAAEFVLTIRNLLRAVKQEQAFAGYIEELRQRFRAKRNFMKLLAEL